MILYAQASGIHYSAFVLSCDMILSALASVSVLLKKNITVIFYKNNLCSYNTRTFVFYCCGSGMLFLDPDVLSSGNKKKRFRDPNWRLPAFCLK